MKRDVRLTVVACGGSFVAWVPKKRQARQSGYVDPLTFDQKSEKSSVTFERGMERIPIETVAALIETLRGHGAAPVDELARDPVGFAQLIAEILELARVIVDPRLWTFLDEQFGQPLSSSVPRVVNGVLHFTVVAIGLFKERTVERISVDGSTGKVERAIVARPNNA